MLEAGTARIDIVPEGELHLIGVYSRKPRRADCIRDPLQARAVCVQSGSHRVVIIACDLLCLSEELHRDVAGRLPEFGPSGVFLAATHTHAGFGGFFRGQTAASMLGAPRPAIMSWLRDRLIEVARRAREDLEPARARWSMAEVPGLVASRRQAGGPHDDRLGLIRFERRNRRPIDVMCASGHPVVVSEHRPHTLSADYPGALCRHLERKGSDPVFLSAALGGVSVLFPEFEMDLERHLAMVTGMLARGHARAVEHLRPVQGEALGMRLVHVPHGPHRPRIFSGLGVPGRVLDAGLALPLWWLGRRMRGTLPCSRGVPLHLVTLGDLCLVGSANELGPTVVGALQEEARAQGAAGCLVASLVDGYAGYLHMPWVYRQRPGRGYRFLALYENALGMFGHQFGQELVAAAGRALGNISSAAV